jgi:hypothetical protein
MVLRKTAGHQFGLPIQGDGFPVHFPDKGTLSSPDHPVSQFFCSFITSATFDHKITSWSNISENHLIPLKSYD